jgi:hypothetical protein
MRRRTEARLLGRAGALVVVVVTVAVAWPCPASAQPASQPAAMPPRQPATQPASASGARAERSRPESMQQPHQPRLTLKSRRTGRLLALGCTLVPLTIAAALFGHAARTGDEREYWAAAAFGALGLGLGPSTGHFYAGEYFGPAVRAVLRTGLAAGGVALIAWAILQQFGAALGTLFGGTYTGPSDSDVAAEVVIGALLAATAVGLAVYDLFDSGRAADRVNAARVRKATVMAPFVARSPRGTQYGLAVVATF